MATLQGAINPRGFHTYYHFDYGTTAGYGSSTPTDPQSVFESNGYNVSVAIGGLNPGTTYHYRVVANNLFGTVYGADQTFTTRADRPTAVTQGLNGVRATRVGVLGLVNPNEMATTYRFDYGTTATYGSSQPVGAEADAGSGDSATTVGQTIYDLNPGTTYHYRVVATNAFGPTYGLDQTFRTKDYDARSSGLLRDEDTGERFVYYTNNTQSAALLDFYGPGGLGHLTLGSGVRAGNNPVTVRDPETGQQWVYFVNSSGGVSSYWMNGSSWIYTNLGRSVRAGTELSLVRNPRTGGQVIYYVNTSGAIAQMSWSPGDTSWGDRVLGGVVQPGASPAVQLDPATANQWIYYVNTSGAVAFFAGNGVSFAAGTIAGAVAPRAGATPSVVRAPDTGQLWVCYVNSSNATSCSWWNGSSWVSFTLAGNLRLDSNPILIRSPLTGEQWVYYVNASNELVYYFFNGASNWSTEKLGGPIKAGATISVNRDPAIGKQWVYVARDSESLWEFHWNGLTWSKTPQS